MFLVLRRTFVGLLAAATAILGGGLASAAGNLPDSDSHTVTYTILSFRAIALGGPNAASVDFGNVRQGHIAHRRGPIVKYATTWAGDRIYVSVSNSAFVYGNDGVDLRLFAYGTPLTAVPELGTGPQRPSSPGLAGDSNGAGVCEGWNVNLGTYDLTPEGQANATLTLSTTTQAFVTGISDCGLDMSGGWARLQTYFSVDARAANSNTDYSDAVTGLVTYAIDFGV